LHIKMLSWIFMVQERTSRYKNGQANRSPSQHNTSHDNIEGDRFQNRGASIANINTDGTFTHAVAAAAEL
jgi:hypothetical protein